MDAKFNPSEIENKWYQKWQENHCFHPDIDKNKESFTIVIPPPNVTGILHMGHGLNNTLQDIIIRYKRMSGYNTLWVPGTDHAGIATQNIVERRLKEQGKTRHDLGREEFIKKTWEVKKEHHAIITEQLKKIGSSCDWERERFTMDEGLSKAVREVFVSLYKKELIYKGKYIINWCPSCHTALSDEEAEHQETDGFFYHYYYPLKEGGQIEIATTRPETMLGDTAVAVNPKDERYKNIIGKTVLLPLTDREIPIIADRHVDMDFGTGCVKVTPCHDPNDYEISLRHNLEKINIFNEKAELNENAPEIYQGLDRFACRKQIIADLKIAGLFIKQEPHKHQVGHCYRCNTIIEPYFSEQWFVKMQPLADKGIKAHKEGQLNFIPKRWEKTYLNWMSNIRDWCISRQIWWGHRIPFFYCKECNWSDALTEDPSKCPECGSTNIYQDEDVLDTWFSSWLWPFSTLGWPEKTADLKHFYPTSCLITAYDIIFFWVSRMIMAGLEFMGEVPFSDIYIHGLIRDKQGRKMSKSLGNGINPLEVVNEYGADAFKFTIGFLSSQGQDILMDVDTFKMGFKFANKIWNASRFILTNIEDSTKLKKINEVELTIIDKWIYERLYTALEKVNKDLNNYRFNEAASEIYDFFWNEFCDWYIEISKNSLYNQDENEKYRALTILLDLLLQALKLLHPFMPFITEEIFSYLPDITKTTEKDFIIISEFPRRKASYTEEFNYISDLKNVIYSVRNIRGELNLPLDKKLSIFIDCNKKTAEKINKHNDIISKIGRIESIKFEKVDLAKGKYASAINNNFSLYLNLEGLFDINIEIERLQKELGKLEQIINSINRKLNNEDFINKAKAHVVEKEKTKQLEIQEKINKLKKTLSYLQ